LKRLENNFGNNAGYLARKQDQEQEQKKNDKLKKYQ
jgi:hypothetical protein